MDKAAAGTFVRLCQLPLQVFLRGTNNQPLQVTLKSFGMPFSSFRIDTFFQKCPLFSLGTARHNIDASADNPAERMICFLLMPVGRLIVFFTARCKNQLVQ